MPRAKKPSRSTAIREVLTANPNAKAKEVVDLLKGKGVKVNAGLVYMVKGSMKSKAGRKRRKAARVAKFRVAKVTSNGTSPVILIKKVRALADEAGGMKALQELVGLLAE